MKPEITAIAQPATYKPIARPGLTLPFTYIQRGIPINPEQSNEQNPTPQALIQAPPIPAPNARFPQQD